jgi:prepilin-type N-terminal cleavage/methylation domain-containing protein
MMMRKYRAFTLIETLLVVAIIALGAALALPLLAQANRAAARTTCDANLRQIGLAYHLYLQDHGVYPSPIDLIHGADYLKDKRLLVCPEDRSVVLLGATSSYAFKFSVQPTFTPLAGSVALEPDLALASCEHHLGQRTVALRGDDTATTAPDFPHLFVLRASGSVDRVQHDAVRKLPLSDRQGWMLVYPREPAYEEAE